MSKILSKDTLMFRETVGEASLGDVVYELTTSVKDRAPIVRQMKTRKFFVLSWEDIIKLAQEAGIDNEGQADEANRTRS